MTVAKESSPTELLAAVAASTGLSNEQVAAVLEALAAQIKKALGNGWSVACTPATA
jgi:nucleoid DNA-binding protein